MEEASFGGGIQANVVIFLKGCPIYPSARWDSSHGVSFFWTAWAFSAMAYCSACGAFANEELRGPELVTLVQTCVTESSSVLSSCGKGWMAAVALRSFRRCDSEDFSPTSGAHSRGTAERQTGAKMRLSYLAAASPIQCGHIQSGNGRTQRVRDACEGLAALHEMQQQGLQPNVFIE